MRDSWADRPVLAAIHYAFFARCFVCRRLILNHSRAELDRCENTPLPILLPNPTAQMSATGK